MSVRMSSCAPGWWWVAFMFPCNPLCLSISRRACSRARWHHTTVLLYSWHSYSVRIATGSWFACMNYTVHSLMYGYFAVTATKYRKVVVPYAMYITLLQLAQMLVGIFVTVKAVLYQIAGEECHVNKTNSAMSLALSAISGPRS